MDLLKGIFKTIGYVGMFILALAAGAMKHAGKSAAKNIDSIKSVDFKMRGLNGAVKGSKYAYRNSHQNDSTIRADFDVHHLDRSSFFVDFPKEDMIECKTKRDSIYAATFYEVNRQLNYLKLDGYYTLVDSTRIIEFNNGHLIRIIF